MKNSTLTDTEKAARELYPAETLPSGLASTAKLVAGIRLRLAARRAEEARRRKLLRAVAALAACAAVAIALGTSLSPRCDGGCIARGGEEQLAVSAETTVLAKAEAAAFAEYEKTFSDNPNEEAFEELESLISDMDYDFSALELESI